MIHSIKIQNFLRIDATVEVRLGPVTVLVGENGSGKSSIIKGVHWAVRCATLSDYRGKVTLEQMDFVPSKDFLDLAHKLKLQNASGGRKILVSFTDDDLEETQIRIGAARNDAGVNVEIDGPLKKELTSQETPSTAYIPGLAGTAEEETILALPIMHRKAASGEGGSVLRQILLALKAGIAGTGDDYVELDELSSWVSNVLPGTRFWVKYDRLRDRNISVRFLTPEMTVPGQSIKVAWKSIEMAGTGFLQVVQIFAHLLYFKPKLLLVDEPDAHLHPGRQQRLIRSLERAADTFPDTKIIITTHSPSLVRALSERATIHWIDGGVIKADGEVVRERMGWNTLDKDILIFSEDGNTRFLQAILSQWDDLANRCAIWPSFGNGGLPNGDKIKKIEKRLGIRTMVHRDSDFMNDIDKADWESLKLYKQNDVRVWYSPVSDIEKAFCNVRHIARSLYVDETIAQEILNAAIAKIDKDQCEGDFSRAYSEAVNGLSARNPIGRWAELGGFGAETIKGKRLIKAIHTCAATVLPSHGLGTKVKNRNRIELGSRSTPLCTDLADMIRSQLE